MKYKDVAALFARAKFPSKGKPVITNARIFMGDDGMYYLRYHDTDIITWYIDGKILLCDGGWNTMSTYRNMNRFLPNSIRVYRKQWNMEIELLRIYPNHTDRVNMEHITKEVRANKPFNYEQVDTYKQHYGKRATYIMLHPITTDYKEYVIDDMKVAIV